MDVDDELGVSEPDRLGPRDVEVVPRRREVAGPDVQVGQGDVEVDRGDARQHPVRVLLQQDGRLRVAPELDQHPRSIDLEEGPEAQLLLYRRALAAPARVTSRASSRKPPISSTLPRLA